MFWMVSWAWSSSMMAEAGTPWDSAKTGHGVGFDEVVVGGAAGHDDGGGDAGFVLADAFEDALALLGRGGAVGLGGQPRTMMVSKWVAAVLWVGMVR